jgi:hypothetical protein
MVALSPIFNSARVLMRILYKITKCLGEKAYLKKGIFLSQNKGVKIQKHRKSEGREVKSATPGEKREKSEFSNSTSEISGVF